MNIISSSHLMPEVAVFQQMISSEKVYIDISERFIKQTFRNRYYIATDKGALPLIVPVGQGKTLKAVKEVEISYAEPWKRIHLKTIRSAYGSSPYFIYYFDEFENIYKEDCKYLHEFNQLLLEWLFKKFKSVVNTQTIDTKETLESIIVGDSLNDIRNKEWPAVSPYPQVFSHQTGFIYPVSILDYLFNQGPSIKKIIT